MTCAVAKGRGAAGPGAGHSAHRLPREIQPPKSALLLTPSRAKALPLKPLHFPNNTLQLCFDFGEDLSPFPPSSPRTGRKYVYFKPPRFGSSFQRVLPVGFLHRVPTSNRSTATVSLCCHQFSVEALKPCSKPG